MSYVLAYATPDKVIIMSDGRARDAITNEITDEYLNKTFRINNNVIVGFTGVKELIEDTIENIYHQKELDIEHIDVDTVTYYLCEIAKELVKISQVGTGINMIIAGLNKAGEIRINTFGNCRNFQIVPNDPMLFNPCICTLFPAKLAGIDLFTKYNKKNEPIEAILKNCITEAATIDESVNNNIFSLTVYK